MTPVTIIKTVFIKSTPERVWSYLTETDKLARWFHEAREDLVTGQSYALLRENPDRRDEPLIVGDVLEADKPKRLVTTFTHEWLGDVVTTVTWELTEFPGGTRLTLTHSGFEAIEGGGFDTARDHDKGWDEHIARLRAVANHF